MKKSVILIFAIAAILVSCKTPVKLSTNDLVTNKWILTTMNNNAIGELETPVSLEFDTAKKGVHGNSGCNLFNGNYVIEGNKITFDNMASTRMYCYETQEIEDEFLSIISNPSELMIKNEQLIFTQNGKEVLVFAKAK